MMSSKLSRFCVVCMDVIARTVNSVAGRQYNRTEFFLRSDFFDNEDRERMSLADPLLLTYKELLEYADSNQLPTLIEAAGNGNAEIVQALLEYGANVNARDQGGRRL